MKLVGGQAVLEGVMMRYNNNVVTAVRNPKGRIVFRREKVKSLSGRAPFSWPVIRGVVSLVESLAIGMGSLNYSADVASHDGKKAEASKMNLFIMVVSTAVSLVLVVALFKLIPLASAQFLANRMGFFSNRFAFNMVEGVLKLGIFIGYILLIGRIKDIRRVFEYHGAEHKAVNCFEAEKKLTVANAKGFSTLNPRCGTSFVLFVILVSIFVYILLPLGLSFWSKLLLRLLLLPVIAGLSYEVLRLGARKNGNALFSAVSAPGMWMQKLTTKEPDAMQLEVALFSLKKVLKR